MLRSGAEVQSIHKSGNSKSTYAVAFCFSFNCYEFLIDMFTLTA